MPCSIAMISVSRPAQARLLARKFSKDPRVSAVYSWEDGDWSLWEDGDYQSCEDPEKKIVNLLFWHTGDDLEAHKPDTAGYQHCVEFSSAGLAEVRMKGHHFIRDAFRTPVADEDTFPLNDDDREQFVVWAMGTRSEPPDLCLGRPKQSALNVALALLCEAYLIAWRRAIPDDPDARDDVCRILLSSLPSAVESIDGGEAFSKVQQSEWWRDVLDVRPDSENLGEDLGSLIEAIFDQSEKKIEPMRVCRAYRALTE